MVTPERLVLEAGRCLSCAACPAVCHSGALNLAGLILEIDLELCDNCLSCIAACPVRALRLENNAKTDTDRS
jgi:ferredoxin